MTILADVIERVPAFLLAGKVWQPLVYVLDRPPSVWKLYKGTGKNQTRTDAYALWWDAMGYGRQWPDFAGTGAHFTLDIDLGPHPPGEKGGDVDNRVKAIQDLVAEMLGIPDGWCDFVSVYRNPTRLDDGSVLVTVIVIQDEVRDAV